MAQTTKKSRIVLDPHLLAEARRLDIDIEQTATERLSVLKASVAVTA